MRKALIGIVLVWFGSLAVSGLGQEVPRAVLVDEHGQLPCDDSLARLDAFYAELHQNPNKQGVIVISVKPDLKHLVAFREGMIVNHARFRSFPADRFEIVRALSDDDLKVQFWIVPPGAERPEVGRVDKSYSLPSSMNPFRLGADYAYVDGICPEVSDFAVFGKFLRDNPSARGNLVVREGTLARAKAKGRQLVREFGNQYGIPSKRLRVFTGRRRTRDSNVPMVEYWFLP